MSKEITTVLLKNSEWLRGEPDSMLLTDDNKLCCLGLACRVFGLPDEEMQNVPGLDNLENLPKGLSSFVSKYLSNTPTDREFTTELYTINDNTEKDYEDKKRVDDLNHVLAEEDIPIRFKFVANA